ncbi:hypothetical protein [Halomarina litorea]|uniref:hypothetical protein n=1 Tax=Halomarina litorea TaxID=2961595 RepID=UPI0020C4D0EF|nr:hypothetical protein [Halomarina sp. BCD28]
MGRAEDLDGRIEALSTAMSGLLDEYLEVQEHLRLLETATSEDPVKAARLAVGSEDEGETAWPETGDSAGTAGETDASRPVDDARTDSRTEEENGGLAGAAKAPASQAAVAAAVEELELEESAESGEAEDSKATDQDDVERIGDDIIVG